MWYEVFFWFCWCSLYGLCEVGLFHFWNLEDCLLCVFVFFLFVSVTFRCHSLADDWRGACQSIFLCLFGFKAGSWWKRPPSHPLARLRVGEDLAVGLSVSLPRFCFNMLHFSGNRFSRISPVKKKKKNCKKTDVVLNKKEKKNNVYNPGEEKKRVYSCANKVYSE